MEKQITFTIKMSETKTLFELLYMGLTLFHGKTENCIKDIYDQIAEKIFKQFIATTKNIVQEDVTDMQVTALREKQADATCPYIEEYERLVFLEAIADRLADKYFMVEKITNNNSTVDLLRERLFDTLKFVGESIIEISAPFLDERNEAFVRNIIERTKKCKQ